MTGLDPAVCSVIVGPDGHGVVRHALALARSTDVAVVRAPSAPVELGPTARRATVVHLHFTDRLFGRDAASGGAAFGRLADGLPGRLVVGVHDVPEPTGTAYAARRIDVYRRVAERADVLVVCSEHERRRLHEIGIDGAITVIPLPIAPPARGDGRPRSTTAPAGAARSVGVLGFIYPGKGHDAVLEAMGTVPDDVTVGALGQVSVGHDDLLTELCETARRVGRRFWVSGFVDDDAELVAAMRLVDVPVVPAASTSASASLCSWIGAGRRPLVAANGFAREIAAIAPDLVTLYRPGTPGILGDAIVRALDEPASTWHRGTIPDALRPDTVAARHLDLYRSMAGR